MTTIERMARDRQNAQTPPFTNWDLLDEDTKRQCVLAMRAAIEALPDVVSYLIEGNGRCGMNVADFREHLLDEQRLADELRGVEGETISG